ncbi:hypothetical protein EV356DRAFT_497388 [Viridothelium virens]|uniref:Uncharacterized protein n=1 Tax=Viridothelium virens TaxID=1048519 RepID=A0A6A6HGW5_VIRVR|nr:hypothetical protein EV356DRAFT_497388 [Viridothelium virens]
MRHEIDSSDYDTANKANHNNVQSLPLHTPARKLHPAPASGPGEREQERDLCLFPLFLLAQIPDT